MTRRARRRRRRERRDWTETTGEIAGEVLYWVFIGWWAWILDMD